MWDGRPLKEHDYLRGALLSCYRIGNPSMAALSSCIAECTVVLASEDWPGAPFPDLVSDVLSNYLLCDLTEGTPAYRLRQHQKQYDRGPEADIRHYCLQHCIMYLTEAAMETPTEEFAMAVAQLTGTDNPRRPEHKYGKEFPLVIRKTIAREMLRRRHDTELRYHPLTMLEAINKFGTRDNLLPAENWQDIAHLLHSSEKAMHHVDRYLPKSNFCVHLHFVPEALRRLGQWQDVSSSPLADEAVAICLADTAQELKQRWEPGCPASKCFGMPDDLIPYVKEVWSAANPLAVYGRSRDEIIARYRLQPAE